MSDSPRRQNGCLTGLSGDMVGQDLWQYSVLVSTRLRKAPLFFVAFLYFIGHGSSRYCSAIRRAIGCKRKHSGMELRTQWVLAVSRAKGALAV